jgi:hypothetical protein
MHKQFLSLNQFLNLLECAKSIEVPNDVGNDEVLSSNSASNVQEPILIRQVMLLHAYY